MNWIAPLNTIACFVLLYFMLATAIFISKPIDKIALVPLAITVFLQMVDPVVGWIPEMTWPAVALNVSLVFAIAIKGKHLWKMARAL